MADGADRGRATSAYDRALRMLTARPHFRAELGRKLAARGHSAEEIEEALVRLAGLGYLDDAATAEREGERLRERRGLGRAGVAAELARKGAGRSAVAAAGAGDDAERELERARETARRWLSGGRDDAAALSRHLDRKGYARHVIFRVLNELLPDAEPPGDAD